MSAPKNGKYTSGHAKKGTKVVTGSSSTVKAGKSAGKYGKSGK
jgi:hypothetical protein